MHEVPGESAEAEDVNKRNRREGREAMKTADLFVEHVARCSRCDYPGELCDRGTAMLQAVVNEAGMSTRAEIDQATVEKRAEGVNSAGPRGIP